MAQIGEAIHDQTKAADRLTLTTARGDRNVERGGPHRLGGMAARPQVAVTLPTTAEPVSSANLGLISAPSLSASAMPVPAFPERQTRSRSLDSAFVQPGCRQTGCRCRRGEARRSLVVLLVSLPDQHIDRSKRGQRMAMLAFTAEATGAM